MPGGDEVIDANKICARLKQFEERAASLYMGFGRRFTDNKDLSWFWLEMSMEEKQHAQFMEFCASQQLVTAGLPEESTVEALAQTLRDLEERGAKEMLSVDDAFLIAAELEGSEINDVYAGVIKPIEGTWHIMRKKVETLTSSHMQALTKAARHFGGSTATLAKLDELQRLERPKAG
jgi:hypothetical protein